MVLLTLSMIDRRILLWFMDKRTGADTCMNKWVDTIHFPRLSVLSTADGHLRMTRYRYKKRKENRHRYKWISRHKYYKLINRPRATNKGSPLLNLTAKSNNAVDWCQRKTFFRRLWKYIDTVVCLLVDLCWLTTAYFYRVSLQRRRQWTSMTCQPPTSCCLRVGKRPQPCWTRK